MDSAALALNMPLRRRRAGMPYRIAMVAACPLPARRGTPLRVERLAEALCARGNSVELITYHVADGPQELDFRVHRIFARPLYWRMPPGPNLRKLLLYDPVLAWKLWQVLRSDSFDILHAHHLEGLVVALPARARFRVPIVYDAHTMLSAELPSYGPSFARRVIGAAGDWLDGLLPRAADHVAAVTGEIRDSLIDRHGMDPRRISVVMNGVEIEAFRSSEQPPADGTVRLIYAGTLAAYQDIELLLTAFARALKVRPDLKLRIAASSSFAPYESRARALGVRPAIELLPDGFAELPRQLATSAIAVMPRTCCPGIPQKLLNYMAAGKAIVASVGSAKLLEHERTGLIVPNGDAQAFAQALLRLAGDLPFAEALGRSAREHVERHCSWGRAAEQLESVYERLVPATASG